MQTRKRAKSITFGTIKEKKEEASKPVSEEKAPQLTEAAKKVQPLDDTLSATPEAPKEKVEEPAAEVSTPQEEFITDASTTKAEPEAPKEESPTTVETVSTPPVSEVSPPISPAPEPKSEEAPATQELSSTPPASAFTIQGNANESAGDPEDKKKHFVLYFLVVALLSFGLGLGAMAVVTYFGVVSIPLPKLSISNDFLKKLNPVKSSPTPEPMVKPTEAPTTKPVDLKAYTIVVLNGSGIRGKAAEVKTSLTTAGFKVGTTGNADRNDYTKTQIAAKKSVDKAYLKELEDELKQDFKLETTSLIPSDSSQTADVTVTLGTATAN